MIRWVFRWLFRLLILLVVLAVAAILLLDTIVREITEYRLQQRTGLEVKIGKMHVSLLQPLLTIENVVIYNSAEFGGSPLIDLPELHVECDRNPLFHSNYHFKLIRLNLARLNVVEDTHGQRNLAALEKKLKKSGSSVITDPILKKKKPADTNAFPQIDTLNLSLGRATYLSMKDPRKVRELSVDIHNRVYRNIQSATELQNILLVILLSKENVLSDEGQLWLNVFGVRTGTNAVKSLP